MSNIQMIESNAGEVKHLFEVMKKYGVACSLEINFDRADDPFIGTSGTKIDTEYLEGKDGDTLIVKLDEVDFAFGLKDHSFSKYITDHQIMIAISENDGDYTAWFNSNVVPPIGIWETNNYDDAVGNDEPFTDDEKELIYYLRSLEFDDVLDAVVGIEHEADKSMQKAAVNFREGNHLNVKGFDERAANLSKLAELLGKANADYAAHIHPEASEDIV
ncbi:hypothetical protein EDM54_01550 [Brevibacillus borstelensis]|uniref:hypothetical protein n=1 Tax=Brevibacillus borstelensis TaxID=45462 RepID=UPI00057BF936|nr:hypothetical protein [Brevibacillus borstelensis]MED1881086.1 hypothetical protein [Brevibacillus borstelensis]RNB66383.1 hypothetical protein EDM54_01550 [Brevibacillus borstelensis]GED53519.1 hypothetical protein BBO01nite_27600 [Brevibacillus borstelensis]